MGIKMRNPKLSIRQSSEIGRLLERTKTLEPKLAKVDHLLDEQPLCLDSEDEEICCELKRNSSESTVDRRR